MGALSEPALPALPGIERFGGRLFHSAHWPEGLDLSGARVAVLGTGASAIQLIPAIQRDAGELTVYQRTAPWVLPHPDRPTSRAERAIYRRAPFAQRVVRETVAAARETMVLGLRHPALLGVGERLGRRHLERQVADPALRELLRPELPAGLQADPDLQPLLPGAHAPQRHARSPRGQRRSSPAASSRPTASCELRTS